MDAHELSAFLVREGARWITVERDESLPLARRLTASENSALSAHVGEMVAVFDVRVRFVPRLWNPPFYDDLPRVWRDQMIEFSRMDAITFVDTVVARAELELDEAKWRSTLLHEFVHVAQYAILGVDGFVREYVDGFLRHELNYDRIPLEEMAYSLQGRFDRGQVFSVILGVVAPALLDWLEAEEGVAMRELPVVYLARTGTRTAALRWLASE